VQVFFSAVKNLSLINVSLAYFQHKHIYTVGHKKMCP